jgi:tetratricopeptide (TPR) repeat protein
VFDTDQKLRHLPFFEEIAGVQAESAEWRAATAGLVTLRLVDTWLDGDLAFKEDLWSIPRVRAEIDAMDETTTQRTMLHRVVDAIRSQKPDIHVLVTPLMAYAQGLEYEAKWLLAGDVYQTALAHLHPIEDGETSIAAHLRLAGCYRNLNMMDLALHAFREASTIGTATGDMVGVLRGRLGEAQVAMFRGDLPKAESLLDATIADAGAADLLDVRSNALNDRSGVALLRGQYELGIRFAYDAFSISQRPNERDKILNNIGAAFANLGVYSAAQDAYLILSATAQEQYLRWAATLNLLEVAYMTGFEPMFEVYRRDLTSASLPPQLATHFQLMVGKGYQRFGHLEKARPHLADAVVLAGRFGFSQLMFEGEAALAKLDQAAPQHVNVNPVPLDLEEIAEAIRDLREAAGVG